MASELASLFAKLAKISGSLGALAKDAKHQQGYSYFSADAVMGHLNKMLAENNIIIIPSAVEADIVHLDDIPRWRVRYVFMICDGDSGAVFESSWTGEATIGIQRKDGTVAIDDKAMGKAHTYAYKYWLMKLFMISTVDTPDLDSNNQEDVNRQQAPKKSLDFDDYVPSDKQGVSNAKQAKVPAKQGKKEADGTQFTGIITVVETRKSEHGQFIIADKCSFWSRQPFRDLGFSEQTIEMMGQVGTIDLPEDEYIRIAYNEVPDGKFKKRVPVKVQRVSTEEVIELV